MRGTPGRRRIEQGYVDKLNAAGIHAVALDAGSLTHNQVNRRIGAPGDTVMTPPVLEFLDGCFRG